MYVFGGRNGYRETLKALAFGDTPALLLGWIPMIGILAGIWALVLSVLGVRELQGISTGRALGAVLVAVIIPLLILVLLPAFLFIAYSEITAQSAAVLEHSSSLFYYGTRNRYGMQGSFPGSRDE